MIDKSDKEQKECVVTVRHRHNFLKQIGSHLSELGIKYGKVVFNFANGKCVGHNIEESEKYK